MQFGWPRSSRKPKPRFCSITPDSLGEDAGAEALNSELMKLQALPSLIDDAEIDRVACAAAAALSPAAGKSRRARSSSISARSAGEVRRARAACCTGTRLRPGRR